MEIGWNILWFIVGVSLLVTVHEFGHFWVARKLGFKVLRFSVGFGKPLYTRVGAAPDHTEFVIAALPLGGYVRMLDERDGEVTPEDRPRAFTSKPPWQRILVMLAGPAANILFAVLILWGIYWVNGVPHVKAVVDEVVAGKPFDAAGLRNGDELRSIDGDELFDQSDALIGLLDAVSDDGEAVMVVRDSNGRERSVTLTIPDADARYKLTERNQLFTGLGFQFWEPSIPAVLGVVEPEGPAGKAGLAPGDEIKAVDGTAVRNFNQLADYIRARPATEVELTVRRDDSDFVRRVTTTREVVNGSAVGRLHIGSAQVEVTYPPSMRTVSRPGPIDALGYSVGKAWQMTAAQAKFFVRMLTGDVSWRGTSGPIGIASYIGDAAHAGFVSFLLMMVLLSLSLGFLNLLPIPILDGGQIVFQLAEWAKGRPLSDRTYMVGQQAGLLLIVLLMGVALFNDLSPYFGV
ncbi:MAG TPA: RIP metalloprotease RseP [Steroidobacteraceae bacterium]|nr:RIP metalloprotease RseP [Steroidobacteraceae bacterium]